MLDQHVKPYKVMCYVKVQILHCEDAIDSTKNKATQGNLVLVDEIEFILGLPCLLPMLEVVYTLIKFA
jgi:hypothetical protein